MPVKSVTIRNLALHENTELEINAPVVLFLGPNESGKSTIKDATRLALDGIWIDPLLGKLPKNRQHLLIRDGQKKAEVIVKTDDKQWTATRTPSTQANNGPDLPVSENALSCLFNSTFYICMDPKERGKMFYELLKLDLSADQLIEQCAKKIGKERMPAFNNDDWIAVKMEYMKGGFDKAQSYVIEKRREFKRELEAIPSEKPNPVLKVEYLKKGQPATLNIEVKPTLTSESIKATLGELQAEKDALNVERGKLEGGQQQSLKWIREQQQAKIQSMANIEKRLASMANSTPDLTKIEEKLSAVKKEFEATRGEIRNMEGKLEAIPEFEGDNCDRCGRKLTKKMVDDLTAQRKTIRREIEAKRIIHNNQQLELQGLQDKRTSLAKGQTEYVNLTTRLATDKEELDRLVASEKDAKDYTKDKARIDEIGAQIQELTDQINGYQSLRTEYSHYRSRLHAYESGQGKRKFLEAQIQLCNALDTLFGPKEGLRAEMSAQAREIVNEILATFTDFLGRKVVLDESLDIAFSDKKELIQLSTSAQRRVGIAMQAAIAILSGMRFFCTDDMENLDEDLRFQGLLNLIAFATQTKLQVWAFAAVGRETLAKIEKALIASPIHGLQAMEVSAGNVAPIGAIKGLG